MAVKNIKIKNKFRKLSSQIKDKVSFEEAKKYFKPLSKNKKERNLLAGLLVKRNKK